MKKRTTYLLLKIIISTLLISSTSLKAEFEQPLSYQLIGQSELKTLWFNIYTAQLWGPPAKTSLDTNDNSHLQAPLLLQLSYQRNISRKKLLVYTKKQLKDHVDNQKLAIWIQALNGFLPNISKGEQLAFHQINQNLGRFYYQDKFIGEINDDMFAQLFIDIWLADNSQYPRQARQLTGREPLGEQM